SATVPPENAVPVAVVDSKPVSTATVMRVEAFVNNWAQSWSNADIKNYLAAYSQYFTTDDGKKIGQWSEHRRQRLQSAGKTRVDVQDLHVYVDMSRQQAIVEFLQSYTSTTYRDRTAKQLLLTLEDNSWRILAERVIAQLPD
ncbi:MAG: colicin import rane protein, partial [Pseudomonadota bacterium]|nr:colicin import rane protein [Pseudomonadota bacterium]